MNKYIMEFAGTLFFVYIMLAVKNPIATGLAFALAIIVGQRISGANYNPAVSIMMAAAGKLPMYELLPYVISQVAGSLAALELYRQMKF